MSSAELTENDALRPSVIRACQSTETFLSSCIPNCHLDSLVIHFDHLDFEINPNGGLLMVVERVIGKSQQNAWV